MDEVRASKHIAKITVHRGWLARQRWLFRFCGCYALVEFADDMGQPDLKARPGDTVDITYNMNFGGIMGPAAKTFVDQNPGWTIR